MISHGKDLKIFSGNSNRALAEAICKELRLPLGDLECGHFSDGECFVSIYETVRGSSDESNILLIAFPSVIPYPLSSGSTTYLP